MPETADATPAIDIDGLRKLFGETTALDGLTLTVPRGSVYGFLGPNGAGKTTTLRILAGLAFATGGTVRVLGHDIAEAGAEAADTRSLIGYLPDVPAFYKWMTAPEYLRFAGSLFGLGGAELEEHIAALLNLANLEDVKTRIGAYSRGMKQRLGVAQALVNQPQLLLLDEPTSALDPIGRREVLEMVAGLRGSTTVFFSTHILADVERVCDTVAVIAQGRLVTEAGIDELRQRRGGTYRLVVDVDDPARLMPVLQDAAWALAIQPTGNSALVVSVDNLATAQRELPALVSRLGLALRAFYAAELSLEDVFVDLVQGGAS